MAVTRMWFLWKRGVREDTDVYHYARRLFGSMVVYPSLVSVVIVGGVLVEERIGMM